VKNTEVLRKISVEEMQFYRNIAREKMDYEGHMLRRGSSRINAVLMLEGRVNGDNARPTRKELD